MAATAAQALSRLFGLLEAFKAFDSDNDGRITAAELAGLLASLGQEVSEEEVSQLVAQGDTDGDGLLSAEEFLATQVGDADADEVVGLLDAALQVSRGQPLPGQELYQALENTGELSSEECVSIAAAMDGDGDGVVDADDVLILLSALM